jgi:hypothetical protein
VGLAVLSFVMERGDGWWSMYIDKPSIEDDAKALPVNSFLNPSKHARVRPRPAPEDTAAKPHRSSRHSQSRSQCYLAFHRQLQRHVAGIARTISHRPRTCIQQSDAHVHSQHVQRQDHAGSASEGV